MLRAATALLLAIVAGAWSPIPRIVMAAEPTRLPDFDAEWDFDHPDSTEARFRSILPAARRAGDPDYLVQLLTQVARAEGLQMKFDDAARTLDEAESLLTDKWPDGRVRVLLERGRLLNSSNRREASKRYFLEAWEFSNTRVVPDVYRVDVAHMLGIVESGDSSVSWNRTAIAIAETSADPKARRWLGSLYNNLGWTYHDKGEYATALDLFQKALRAREESGKKSDIRVARWCVARAMRSLGRLDEALAMQEALLAEGKAEQAPDGYVEEEIGECLLGLGRPAEATPHFAAAHALLSADPWLQRDEAERLERLRRLGGVPEPAPKKP
ncbi:MAG TPA: tetratricopeptide repeat protein [Candidatus Eisenbacteria bacterium]|nr:tetratricopeptide repeat protein [Candidatus Eisenbacteria bacterium]